MPFEEIEKADLNYILVKAKEISGQKAFF